jgi:hypothetical protein
LNLRYYIIFVFVLGASILGKAQKTDTIFHTNGNILLGEIKKIDYGRVTFKMDGMGTILVDIDRVKTMISKKFFEFNTTHGRTIYGSIDSSNINGVISINSGYDSNSFHLYQMIEVYPIKSTFFLRTSGKIALGFNYTKASNVGRFDVDWSITYRNKGTSLTLEASNIQTFTPNDTAVTTSKTDFSLNIEKKIKGIWAWNSYIGGSQNTELGLSLRLKGGLGIQGDVFHTSNQRFYVILGLAPNVEFAESQVSNTTNLEGQVSISYQIFKYNFPEISLNTKLDFYPSLNSLERYRVDYNFDANIEIFYNFYVGGKFYYNFDSKPASETGSNDDYGFTTTIGYTFH